MSHQDSQNTGRGCVELNSAFLKLALHWLFGKADWSTIRWRSDCTWTPMFLSATALLWAVSGESTLGDRFQISRKISLFLYPELSKSASSYQGFIKLLAKWTDSLVGVIQTRMRQLMEQALAEYWRINRVVMFGIDGCRVDLPRTKSNQATYATSRKKNRKKQKKGKGKRGISPASRHKRLNDSPQMWLTTMWHAGTGLPWDWRTGPSDSSERAHLLEMLSDLPAEALITADAGFVGYEYSKAILDSGRDLLIRVGSNVRLLRQLGYAREFSQTVYIWPTYASRRKEPPLVLRLVVAHNGRHPVYVVTSLRSKTHSDRQILELYSRRWGIELFYRSFKQTFGKRKLRSHAATNTTIELAWSLMGLWIMSLYALVQVTKTGIEPRQLSAAKLLRAFRSTLRDYRIPVERGQKLRDQLRAAVIGDSVRRNKSSRNYPRKRSEKQPGKPQIINATDLQISLAKTLSGNA